MRKILLSLIYFILITHISVNAAQIIIEGNYQGKNLYIQNPFASNGVGFCVQEVLINDRISTDEINSSAFEIDFSSYRLQIGDKVVIKIIHKDECKPKVLNPEVLKPKSTFEIVSMKVDADGMFVFVTQQESGKLPFVVEQFRWNKWVKIAEVQGKGTPSKNTYSTKVNLHSGENKIRVKQTDFSGNPRSSEPYKTRTNSPELTFSPLKVADALNFSGETMYEIYDSYGNLVKKGAGNNAEVAGLKKGIYYLNFDNKTDKFVKK